VVFDDKGRAKHMIRKTHLTEHEQPYMVPGRTEDLTPVDTPAGKIGILICADSWHDECYDQIRGCEAVVVPSYSIPSIWEKPWQGYSGHPAPADVDRKDIGSITLGQAWQKYAVAGRCVKHGISHGLNVFLYTKLYDFQSDGASSAISCGQVLHSAISRHSMINLGL